MQTRFLLKRLVLVQFVVFILVFSAAGTAHAQGIVYGDQVPAGQVVENDAVLFGDNVSIDGTVEGDVVAAGSFIQVNGKINGSLIAFGETVVLNGEVDGTVYSAAVTMELGEESVLHRNLYFAGLDLVQQSGSSIERDLVAASLIGASLNGTIGRNTQGIFGPSALIRLIIEAIGGQVNLPGLPPGSLQFDNAYLSGTRSSMSLSGTSRAAGVILVNDGFLKAAVPGQGQPTAGIDTELLEEWLSGLLREFVILLVFGFLGLWLFSPFLNRSAEALSMKPLSATGYGLLALIVVINLFFVGALLAVLILVIGVWLGMMTLWDLAFAFWAVGFSSLVLALAVFVLFVNYGTKIIVAYLLGKLILRLFTLEAADYRMAPLLLGLLVFVLLHSIPLLGWVIGVIFTALGLGAVVVKFIADRKPVETVDVIQE
jgi:hypothetical protein